MTGYVRQSEAEIQDDEIILSADLNAEFDAIEAFADATTGHTHDGTVGGGAPIAYGDITGTPTLSTVATSGNYSDLSGLPTLGTAAATDSTDYATAAQGALADTAVQPSEMIFAAQCRLSLSATEPFMDNTTNTTLYLHPYKGNQLWLIVSGIWIPHYITSPVSISVASLTAARVYDVFAYSSSGTITLELEIWTNNTTRATALTRVDGVYVKDGDSTRRYIGTIKADSDGVGVSNTYKLRCIWNYYNRRPAQLFNYDGTASWTYSSTAWRQVRGNTANQIEVVIGINEDNIPLTAMASGTSTVNTTSWTGIGLNSTSPTTGGSSLTSNLNSFVMRVIAMYNDSPGIGFHTFTWLEYGGGTGTQTWYGSEYTGLRGTFFC